MHHFVTGNYLGRNTVLKELWLAHNDLNSIDAVQIGNVLKKNFYLQFLDVSNNSIKVMNICYVGRSFFLLLQS